MYMTTNQSRIFHRIAQVHWRTCLDSFYTRRASLLRSLLRTYSIYLPGNILLYSLPTPAKCFQYKNYIKIQSAFSAVLFFVFPPNVCFSFILALSLFWYSRFCFLPISIAVRCSVFILFGCRCMYTGFMWASIQLLLLLEIHRIKFYFYT